ncbi:MAG: hypothetical protein J2P19_01345 [Pseudonocardia sp.]|nr:hypothetical protein [Pseudonocardia sp.]
MIDPRQPDQPAPDEDPDQEPTRLEQNQDTDQAISEPPHADPRHTEAADTPAESTQPRDDSIALRKATRKGLLLGLGASAVVVIVVLALAAFVWPAGLVGPGKPDGKAAQAVAALASKNPGELEKASCHGPDGNPTAQLPPQALRLIQTVKQAGPPRLLLDTQARTPVDLTLSAQGQTQNIPIDVVLGVTRGEWCMAGIAERQ